MAQVRINFTISEAMKEWLKSQPNIDALDNSQNSTIVTHHMTGPESQALKTAFIDKLIEVLP